MSASNFLKRFLLNRLPIIVPRIKFVRVFVPTSLMFSVKNSSEAIDKESVASSLSCKSLIRHASSVTVTSVNQLLVLSAAALIEYHETYRSAMENMLRLMNDIVTFINSEPYQEKLWEEMVAARSEFEDAKKELIEMQSFMDYVEKLVTDAAETAYLAGSEYSSTTICESFNATQQKLELEKNKTKDLESEYRRKEKAFMEKLSDKGKTPPLDKDSV